MIRGLGVRQPGYHHPPTTDWPGEPWAVPCLLSSCASASGRWACARACDGGCGSIPLAGPLQAPSTSPGTEQTHWKGWFSKCGSLLAMILCRLLSFTPSPIDCKALSRVVDVTLLEGGVGFTHGWLCDLVVHGCCGPAGGWGRPPGTNRLEGGFQNGACQHWFITVQ